MNWSVYAKFVGNVFGAPLAIEGLAAFFPEATFLGLWIFGWDRLSPRCSQAAESVPCHMPASVRIGIGEKEPKPFKYKDKATMATIGRGAAVVQMLGGRTMTGYKAQAAWGAVHLALLPTNEDCAKAAVDWAGAATTYQRAGRITVESS